MASPAPREILDGRWILLLPADILRPNDVIVKAGTSPSESLKGRRSNLRGGGTYFHCLEYGHGDGFTSLGNVMELSAPLIIEGWRGLWSQYASELLGDTSPATEGIKKEQVHNIRRTKPCVYFSQPLPLP